MSELSPLPGTVGAGGSALKTVKVNRKIPGVYVGYSQLNPCSEARRRAGDGLLRGLVETGGTHSCLDAALDDFDLPSSFLGLALVGGYDAVASGLAVAVAAGCRLTLSPSALPEAARRTTEAFAVELARRLGAPPFAGGSPASSTAAAASVHRQAASSSLRPSPRPPARLPPILAYCLRLLASFSLAAGLRVAFRELASGSTGGCASSMESLERDGAFSRGPIVSARFGISCGK